MRTRAPAGAANGSEHARREPARAGTLTLIARAAAHDRISAALRSARERAGLDEQQVIDLLRARGVSISIATLERWERTGGIRLEEAVDLAAVYHMSLDELAGRRALARPLPGLRGAHPARCLSLQTCSARDPRSVSQSRETAYISRWRISSNAARAASTVPARAAARHAGARLAAALAGAARP